MINTYDYVSNIIGMDLDEQKNISDKLDIEVVPGENVFGIGDGGETRELGNVLKNNFINRINICFPLDENDEELIKNTIRAIQDLLLGGIHVSMSNIDTIDKITRLQEACGNAISYFSKAANVPDVEQYCRARNIPFLPVAGNRNEFLQRIAEGYRVVKAYPFGANGLIDLIKDPRYAALLYTPAGGIKPLIKDGNGILKVSDVFLDCSALKNVINICTTAPMKECLIKSEDNLKPLEKFNKYLQLVPKG